MNASPGEVYLRAQRPIYKNGKLTPSLHADSADSRWRRRDGTLSLNVDLARTEAARTGSVGERQAPIIIAEGRLVWKIKYAKRLVMAHEKVMIGPRK